MFSNKQSIKIIAAAALLLVLVGAAVTAAGCGGAQTGSADQQTLTVSAAVSLKDVFSDLGHKFEKAHPGVKVNFNFGASGDLEQQVAAGAPVDVFAAASTKETTELLRQGKLDNSTLIQPITNDVVLAAPANSMSASGSFNDLTRFAKLAIGNPDSVPAGRYARDVLVHFGEWDAVKPKLVYGESVRQVLDYVARGEVDAGIVYATDAAARSREVKVLLTAPADSHQPVAYPMAVVSGSPNAALAKQFLAYLSSGEARKVFEKYGFRWTR